MISLGQLKNAVNNQIRESLRNSPFENIPILAADLSEPIIRPSIKVLLEDSRSGKFNGNFLERNITCRIYFFSQNNKIYFDDCHLMQELLEMGFYDGLYISGTYWVGVDEIESDIIDTVLEVSFELYYMEEKDETAEEQELEMMEVLYQE